MKSLKIIVFSLLLTVSALIHVNATIVPYITNEVGGISDSSADSNTGSNAISLRNATQNLITPWKAYGTTLGCQMDVANLPISGTTPANTYNVISNGVNVTLSTRNVDTTPGSLGILGTNFAISGVGSDSLQDGAPRPSSLYTFGAQPTYLSYNSTAATTKNGILYEFSSPVRGFGAWFGDLETRNDQPSTAYMRLFDSTGTQIGSDIAINPDTSFLASHPSGNSYTQANCGGTNTADITGCGNGTTKFVGFWALPSDNVSKVLIVVGDDDPGDTGNNELLSFIGPIVANNCGLKLGNQAWKDNNANGLYESGELPLSGAEMNLFADTDSSGTLTSGDLNVQDIDGNTVSSIMTTSNGQYLFSNLKEGNYIVAVRKSSLPNVNYTVSPTYSVTDPDDDVNNNHSGVPNNIYFDNYSSLAITLTSGTEPINDEDTLDSNGNSITLPADGDSKSNLTLDFGFFESPRLTVTKIVDNKGIGTKQISDFELSISDDFAHSTTTLSGSENVLTPGIYTVSETNDPNYIANYSGDCDAITHDLELLAGDVKTCTITNTFNPAKLTITKVIENGLLGTKEVSDFELYATNSSNSDMTEFTTGIQKEIFPGTYTISETNDPNYIATYSGDCDAITREVILNPGEEKTCTITNTFNPAKLTITKIIENGLLGTKEVSDFELYATDTSDNENMITFISGISKDMVPGRYKITESVDSNYDAIYSGDCDTISQEIVLEPGSDKTCTITNTSNIKAAPVLTITKLADATKYSKVGTVITYSYVVKNTGNIEISDIKVLDDKISTENIFCPQDTLQVNESIVCTGQYTTRTQDLITTGLTNIAYSIGRISDDTQVKSTEVSLMITYEQILGETGYVIDYKIFNYLSALLVALYFIYFLNITNTHKAIKIS
jgi:uncharacterized repeat protein (TIGR01451 family)